VDIAPTVLNLLDIPVPARMRGADLGPWLGTPPAPDDRLPPAFAEVEDKRMIVKHDEKLICDLHWGFCSYYDLAADPGEKRNRADDAPERVARLRAVLDDWLDGHIRFEPVLTRGAANPGGEGVPKAVERGRLGDVTAASALADLVSTGDVSLPIRREAVELLVGLPARPETRERLVRASRDPDAVVADWAAVGAVRVGDIATVERVRNLVADPTRIQKLRVRGALALAAGGDAAGVPRLAQSLADCPADVSFCRLVIAELGRLRDRRAVPALLQNLAQVQNRREMVDALGDIGDPAAISALLDRLQHDAYVPVRAQAARALAKIGRGLGRGLVARDLLPALDRSAHEDTEALVSSAAREAIAALQSVRRP
jgi:HEAT repeat protein